MVRLRASYDWDRGRHLESDARGVAIEFDDDTGAPGISSPKPMSERDDCVIHIHHVHRALTNMHTYYSS